MSIPRSWTIAAVLGLGLAALLPWVGHQMRARAPIRCALDGAAIVPSAHVRVLGAQQRSREFCSLSCAEKWLRMSRERPEVILVTDEATGDEIPAAVAYFVRSQVIAHGPSRERRHVFRLKHDAVSHSEAHFGHILEGTARPFAQWLERQPQPVATQSTRPGPIPDRAHPKT